MRRTVPAIVALVVGFGIWGTPSPAAGDAGDRRVAVAASHPSGTDAVYLGERVGKRRLLWRAPSRHVRIITEVAWSKRRDALAFATTNRLGAIRLVVVLIGGDLDGHVMSWPIPSHDRARVHPTVTWLGRRRVAFGRSELRPDVVASWSVRQ